MIAVCDEKVLTEKVICESEGSHTLTCPKDHMVVIHEAKYYRSLQPGCGLTWDESCFVDITNNLFRKCYKAQPCSFEVESQSFGGCARNHTGEVYLKIVYQCEPRKLLGLSYILQIDYSRANTRVVFHDRLRIYHK